MLHEDYNLLPPLYKSLQQPFSLVLCLNIATGFWSNINFEGFRIKYIFISMVKSIYKILVATYAKLT